ncbi:MAG TPA: ABC transporter permease [Nitrososphaeraceae archaeon]|nr:ABC transporter permease [Nitrososphaeraceae archaeon]
MNIAFTQIVFIAHMTGILWLRRNPLSMLFSAISPFSILFVLFVVSNGQYTDIGIAGSLVMATVGYGLALGQDISYYKTEYKIQDIFVASPVSSLTYMTGLALSELLFGLPALTALTILAVLLGDGLSTLPLLIFSILLTWGAMSAMGFFLSSHMLHMRNATQIISFVNVILAVIPPVYYSIERLPLGLQYLAYSVPTTHASLMIQDSLGLAVPENWSIYLGLTIQTAYLIGFLVLARARAVWRDL